MVLTIIKKKTLQHLQYDFLTPLTHCLLCFNIEILLVCLLQDCYRPLGLQSGSVKDNQITAINTRGSHSSSCLHLCVSAINTLWFVNLFSKSIAVKLYKQLTHRRNNYISLFEGYWEPHLARLNNQGKYNAWSTEQNSSWIHVCVVGVNVCVRVCVCACMCVFDTMWIQPATFGLPLQQVDFQRPVVISQVATQGARQWFHSQFVVKYSIAYSTDRRKWVFYKGDSRDLRKVREIWSPPLSMLTATNWEKCVITNQSLSLSPLITRYSLGTRKPMRQKEIPSFLLWLDGSLGSTLSNGTTRLRSAWSSTAVSLMVRCYCASMKNFKYFISMHFFM